jgi:hypothetical protein
MFQLPVLAVDDPWHISHERGAELPHDGERFNFAVVQQAPAQIRALHEDVTKGQGEHHLGGAHVEHRDILVEFMLGFEISSTEVTGLSSWSTH